MTSGERMLAEVAELLAARELVARVALLERWHLVHDRIAAAWAELDSGADIGRAEAVHWADVDADRRRRLGDLEDLTTNDRGTEDAA